MEHILDRIVARKRIEIAEAQRQCPLEQLADLAAAAPPPRDFAAALANAPGVGLIAEVKRASPSAGVIRAEFDPVAIATVYERHGATCLSVLTDEHFFGGHLDHLREVRRAVAIPVLRKDFILDPYQILEARAAGADCVLLIAECLDDASLAWLYHTAAEVGMHALVEIHDADNLDRALALRPRLLGINNRDLRTFETTLERTLDLAGRAPAETLLVSESGIRTRGDVAALERAGVRAILVGETLMRADDVGAKVRELLGGN